ncbi:MAG TPA: hypothetical protein VFA49_03525 [Chloroflexota bacterium]|nr:hypothetical protein [Chloroflexota bacterium]
MLREPIGLLLAVAVLGAAGISVAARQGFQALHQTDVSGTLAATRPNVQAIASAVGAFEAGSLGEDALRTELDRVQLDAVVALEPLSSAASLRGTFLDESDAATGRASRALRGELDELATALRQDEGLTQVAYRAERVVALVAQPGSGLAVDAAAAASTHRVWLRAYVRDLQRADAGLQAQTDDLARWRTAELPGLSSAGAWDDIGRRVARARVDVEGTRDRVRALPAPAEALRPLQEYTSALGQLDQAMEALGAFGDTHAQGSLVAADQALNAYRATRQSAVSAIQRL